MTDIRSAVEVFDLLALDMQEHVSAGTRYAGSYTGLCGGSARELRFNVSVLEPGSFSCPYHFHHAEEEVFLILAGAATLRTPAGHQVLEAGSLFFCPKGPGGAHQLYNHTDQPCRYLGLSNKAKVEVAEYPDSGERAPAPPDAQARRLRLLRSSRGGGGRRFAGRCTR